MAQNPHVNYEAPFDVGVVLRSSSSDRRSSSSDRRSSVGGEDTSSPGSTPHRSLGIVASGLERRGA